MKNEDRLKEILYKLHKIRDLISEGLAKSKEKSEVLQEAKVVQKIFTHEIFKRKAEKLATRTLYTSLYHDGFVAESEANDLTPWIDLITEYLDKGKVKRRLEKEGLWIESVQDGEDEHIFVGEKEKKGQKVHLIRDGGTGELRIDPKDQQPHELLQRVETVLTLNTGEKIRSTHGTLEFINKSQNSTPSSLPVLDVYPPLGKTGGSNGHIVTFTIKNVSKDTAINCLWRIRGFGYEWSPEFLDSITLQPNYKEFFEYKISDHKIFNEKVAELNIVIEYENLYGDRFFTRRDIEQVLVRSGDFFNLRLGKFHPPEKIVDYGIKSISAPVQKGDGYESKFEVEFNGERKIVAIGISLTLLSIWGFTTEEDIAGAINELGGRKVRKMLIEKKLENHLFTTFDSPEKAQKVGGFDNYKLLRDSL